MHFGAFRTEINVSRNCNVFMVAVICFEQEQRLFMNNKKDFFFVCLKQMTEHSLSNSC
jgi:hypothetical protein